MDKEIAEQLYDPKKKYRCPICKKKTSDDSREIYRHILRDHPHEKPKGRIYDQGSIPSGWFKAMYEGIRKRSDVRNPGKIVRDIWKRLSPRKKAQIKSQAAKGKPFKYDLPLPEDHPTRGIGTVRIVMPFNLGEVQVNVSPKAYARILKSGLFERMRRQDGTIALVKRCKSKAGNCNIFIDRR